MPPTLSPPARPLISAEGQKRRALVHGVNPTGRIGIVGVYLAEDPGGVDKSVKQGQFRLPLGDIFEKGLTIGAGRVTRPE